MMKSILLLLFASVTVFAADLEICRFRGNKTAAISLTYDDGRRNHIIYGAPLMEKYGFRGTFYIVTTWVAAKQGNKLNSALTWNEIKELADRGHEIGNHSVTHYQLTKQKDMEKVRQEINDPVPVFASHGIHVETFCYPGCASNNAIEKIVLEQHLGASRSRFGCGGKKYTLDTWKGQLKTIADKRMDAAMMIHAIHPQGGYSPFTSVELYEQCLQELKKQENLFYVAPYAEVTKYKLLRSSSKIIDQENGSYELQCSRPDAAKLGSLTLKYTGPEKIKVFQNQKEIPVKDNLFDVVPGTFSIKK